VVPGKREWIGIIGIGGRKVENKGSESNRKSGVGLVDLMVIACTCVVAVVRWMNLYGVLLISSFADAASSDLVGIHRDQSTNPILFPPVSCFLGSKKWHSFVLWLCT